LNLALAQDISNRSNQASPPASGGVTTTTNPLSALLFKNFASPNAGAGNGEQGIVAPDNPENEN